jgi:hypothetical protein
MKPAGNSSFHFIYFLFLIFFFMLEQIIQIHGGVLV